MFPKHMSKTEKVSLQKPLSFSSKSQPVQDFMGKAFPHFTVTPTTGERKKFALLSCYAFTSEQFGSESFFISFKNNTEHLFSFQFQISSMY